MSKESSYFLECTVLFIFLIGCSKDETEPQLFNYNLSLRVPKGAVISNEYKSFDNTSPYYDEYNIKSKSEEENNIENTENKEDNIFDENKHSFTKCSQLFETILYPFSPIREKA